MINCTSKAPPFFIIIQSPEDRPDELTVKANAGGVLVPGPIYGVNTRKPYLLAVVNVNCGDVARDDPLMFVLPKYKDCDTLNPIGPEGPLGPATPKSPAGPDGPIFPEGPEGPLDPEGPDGPEAPEGPVSPLHPLERFDIVH